MAAAYQIFMAYGPGHVVLITTHASDRVEASEYALLERPDAEILEVKEVE